MTDYCRSAMSPFSTAAAANRRSYSCYNCNYSFYITLIPTTSDNSAPSPFRCPSCHHRHLIPHHTVSVPLYLPPPPPPPPPPPRSLDYQASDESEEEDYDSDNSLLSFSLPSFHSSSPASKSFVASLPIKYFALDLPPPLPSCSICLEDLDISPEGSLVINELPCEHYFHKNCIVKWLQRSNTCPLCRYELPVDDSPEEGAATGSPEEGASTGTYFNWYEEDAVLVVDISWEDIFGSNAAPPSGSDGFSFDGMPGEDAGRVSNAAPPSGSDGMPGEDAGRVSNAAASGSGGLAVNGREVSGLESDPMRDEDGDTFMVDA